MCRKEEKAKTVGAEMTENRGDFEIKVVMISPLKNYDFCCQ